MDEDVELVLIAVGGGVRNNEFLSHHSPPISLHHDDIDDGGRCLDDAYH